MEAKDSRHPLLDFACPLSWAELSETTDPKQRHCHRCRKPVIWCDSEEEAEQQEAGVCVAFAVETSGSEPPADHKE